MSKGARRFGLFVSAYAFAITMVGTTLPTPLYVLYRQRFGFSELMITVIFATYAAGVIAALLLFGALSDEIGRRRVLLPGLALSAFSAVAFLLAQGLVPLLVGRALSGLSAGIFTGTATATIIDFADPAKRGRATLIATMANMGGLGCGPLLAGILAQSAGAKLRLSYWVDLALLLPAVAGLLAMREPVANAGTRPAQLKLQALAVPDEVRATFIRAALAGFAGFAVLGLFTSVSPAFLGQELHVNSHATVGLVVFVVFAASTIGQLSLEKIPERTALPLGCAILVAGMALLAAGIAAASLALLVAGGVVAGLGQGLSFRAGLSTLNAESEDQHRGAVASSFFVVAYVAISLPVIGVGVLAQAASLKTAGLVFSAVVAALAALALALLARRS